MKASEPVSCLAPKGRDMRHSPSKWDSPRDTHETLGTGKPREPQETAATGPRARDTERDTLETANTGECLTLPVPLCPVGQPALVPWTVPEWRGFYEERRAIRQFDGGQPEALAARGAWLDAVALWLERHPVCPVAEYTWPPDMLRLARLAEAIVALGRLGIAEPPPPPRIGQRNKITLSHCYQQRKGDFSCRNTGAGIILAFSIA
jgi:hypothetical protein